MRTLVLLATFLLAIFAPATNAANAAAGAQQSPRDYESKNFLLHTDLPEEQAEDLLKRLETMLDIISRYWAAPNRKTIECYVVHNLANWPAGSIDPRALPIIQARGGITTARYQRVGNRVTLKATAWGISTQGTPQHEAVHAYCYQTFGTPGPLWYAEGMAEMGSYWVEGDHTVNCPPFIVKYLRQARPAPTVREVRSATGAASRNDSWRDYAWRWALCHLLANNKNYSDRFRPLGLGLLTKKKVSFGRTYGAMEEELQFEYQFFLDHLQPGYDVSLCSWDWKARFRPLRSGASSGASVRANRGWQASRLRVAKGEELSYSATGTWKIEAGENELTAAGADDGAGRLVGVLMKGFTLGEPFELGAEGQFTAPEDGDLYLRCRDEWNSLTENEGTVRIRFQHAQTVEKP